MDDLDLAYSALSGKQAVHANWWRYYDGNHPLIYSTQRLREIFQHIDARFSENWCAVVIDAVLDRIALRQFVVANDAAATATLNELFESTGLGLDAHDVHLAALVTGEAFVLAWPDTCAAVRCVRGSTPDSTNRVQGAPMAYYNDPLLCHAFYDPENPRQMRMAAKWYLGDDERRYLTLYYPDRLEYYVSRGKAHDIGSARAFVAAQEPEVNPYGQIPVFHFRRERRAIKSELANVIEPQNAINKLVADMMIAAEFGAAPQRYIISQGEVGNLLNAPNVNWLIPAGDGAGQPTQVGQLEATRLDNYLEAIDKFATAIAVISRTPRHYLFAQGGDPSGEALIAMEAPLNRKCQRFVEVMRPVWCSIGAFLLRLAGGSAGAGAIDAVYADVRTVQPRMQAEIRRLKVQSGMPLATVLRDEGWTEAELAELRADQVAERAELRVES